MDFDHQNLPRLIKSQRKSYNNKKGKRKSNNDSLKVVYISTPMKVKTSASRFRSLVQQLTGKNSDVSRYMEANNMMIGARDFHEIDCEEINHVFSSKEVSRRDTPTSSESLFGSMDNEFGSQIGAGIKSLNSFFEPSDQLNVLGNYDEIMN